MLVVIALSALVATATPALAPDDDVDQRPSVQVDLAGDAARVAAVRVALDELLRREGIHPRVATVSAIDPAGVLARHPDDQHLLARVAVDLDGAGFASILLVDPRLQRALVRQVPTQPGVDEVATEEIAHIIASSLRALRDGAPIGVARAEALAAIAPAHVTEARTAVPARAASSPVAVALGVAGEAAAWSDAAPAVPAIAVSLMVHQPSSRWGGELSADFRTLTAHDDPIALRLTGGTVAALATLDWGTHVMVAAGPGIDLTRVAPGLLAAGSSGVALGSPHLHAVPLARITLRLQEPITRTLTLFASLVGDVLLTDVSYTVERQGQTESVFHPWRVRPAALLGAEMTFGR